MKCKILNNYVFIKPHDHFSKVLAKDGTVLLEKLDTRFEVEKNYASSGTVTHLPDKLWYEPDEVGEPLRYKTELDLQVGDTVINHYLAPHNAQKRDIFIVNEDKSRSYGVRYDYVYLRIRDNIITPLNGFIVVKPLSDIIDAKFLLTLPVHVRKKKAMQKGVVMYTGKCVSRYRVFPEYGGDADDVFPGDVVLYPKFDNVPLQNDFHAIVNRGTHLIRMQRRDIAVNLSKIKAA